MQTIQQCIRSRIVMLHEAGADRRLKHCATGFVIRIGAERVLLTAGHFVRNALSAPTYVGLGGISVSLDNWSFMQSNDDKLDYCYSVIPPSVHIEEADVFPATALGMNFALETPMMFVTVGYPNSRNKGPKRIKYGERRISPMRQSYDLFPIVGDGALYERFGIDVRSHIAFRMEREGSVDVTGRPIVAPHPRGMSGSPIFYLMNRFCFDHVGIDRPIEHPIVALLTEYHENAGIVIGTRIDVITETMRANMRSSREHLAETRLFSANVTE